MHLEQNIPLRLLHTFGFNVKTRYFVEAKTIDDIRSLLNYRSMIRMPVLILGGGSNLIFTKDFEGIIIRINTKGITVRDCGDKHVLVTAQAGETWDAFVQYCVGNGWAGLENLSLIPGTAGAAPIQNIGAYGVEVKDFLESVRFVEIDSGKEHTFNGAECHFAYRDSIFKQELKGKIIITDVCFKLLKTHPAPESPYLHLDYGDIHHELWQMGIAEPGISDVREAVCRIRRRKLPDPALQGNAGSFFKNPVIEKTRLEKLNQHYPSMPSFQSENMIKVPAAWLISECGWKGFRAGDAGVHHEQPLVLVNYGQANGMQIMELAQKIIASVYERFRITLEPEVNIF